MRKNLALKVLITLCVCFYASINAKAEVEHKKVTRWLGGKPAIVNIITVTPTKKTFIRPTYGEYALNAVKPVREFVEAEKALAGVNASFFKPDIGAPLGVSIIDGELMTGPIYERVVFGINQNNEFLMDKVKISGLIKIGDKLSLNLINYNQPVFSWFGYTVFTDRWGDLTPPTSEDFCHVVVVDNKIRLIKQSSVNIPEGGYVLVGPRELIRGIIEEGSPVSYELMLMPVEWNKLKYAVGGGPYLVKKGRILIDDQRFTKMFLWKKEPRTAIGYTKDGILHLVTVDGRKKGVTEGATMLELAKIMIELNCYNAMNLDGGSSTQMVYNGELVNLPTVKGGGKVTNALLVCPNPEYE